MVQLPELRRYFFFFFENAKNLGPSDDTKRTEQRKEEDGLNAYE